MSVVPFEISLDILPRSRLDIIDVTNEVAKRIYDQMRLYKKACYCSFHTTAGYLEQSFCSRLQYNTDNIKSFIIAFQKLFPRYNWRNSTLSCRSNAAACAWIQHMGNSCILLPGQP